MNKDRFYQLIILALLVLLGLFMGKFLMKHKGQHDKRGRGPKHIVIDRLNLDEEQIQQYQSLIGEHKSSIHLLDKKIRNNKKDLYQLLIHDAPLDSVDSLTSAIANVHKRIEETNFKHFQDIRSLCRKDQMELYEDLTQDLAKIFSKKPPKHRK